MIKADLGKTIIELLPVFHKLFPEIWLKFSVEDFHCKIMNIHIFRRGVKVSFYTPGEALRALGG
jgi:hypothetical protein